MLQWDFDDLHVNTWVLLQQTWEAISEYLRLQLSELRVSRAQIDILMILCASDGSLTERQLARLRNRTPQSMSILLRRMEEAGYLKRGRSTRDQRMVKVRILPKGLEVANRARQAGFVFGSRMMKAALLENEVGQLGQILTKLRDATLQETATGVEPPPDCVDRPSLLRKRALRTG